MSSMDSTNFGLANRFKVVVNSPNEYDLGAWQKAEGLDVTWDMPDYRAGDAGNARWFFPANTKYSSIKLIRAVCDDSEKVRKWLHDNSFTFQKSETQATITLYDPTGTKPVLHWDLINAKPKKWSINNMDAGASAISVETLEFDHEGFLGDDTKIG